MFVHHYLKTALFGYGFKLRPYLDFAVVKTCRALAALSRNGKAVAAIIFIAG